MNSTFHARWLASSAVISQVLFTSEQLKKNKMAFVGILPQIKLLFGLPVIQLVWYILKQLFTSVSVKVVNIYLALCASVNIHHYSPPLWWIVNYYVSIQTWGKSERCDWFFQGFAIWTISMEMVMSSVFFVFESRQTPDLEYNTILFYYASHTQQKLVSRWGVYGSAWFQGFSISSYATHLQT